MPTTKVFDIRVSRNGEIIDALSLNKATPVEISAVLTLVEPGDEVIFICKDFKL